jgi:hypothetical protein
MLKPKDSNWAGRVLRRLGQLLVGAPGRFVLGTAISLLTLYLSFRMVDMSEVWAVLSQLKWGWIGLTLVVMAVNHLGKTLRWKVLLKPAGIKLPFLVLLGEMMAGQMWNLVAPARLGDLNRIQQVGSLGLGRTFVLSSLVVEKTLDMLAYAFLFVLLLVSWPVPEWLMGSGILFTVVTLGFTVLIVLAVKQRSQVRKILDWVLKFLPGRVGSFILARFERLVDSLVGMQEKKILLAALSWTGIAWMFAIATNWTALMSLDLALDIRASVFLLLALQAGISLPSLPARVGLFEYICILSLGIFGVDQASALSFGLLLHFLVMAPILLSGILFFAWSGIRKKEKEFDKIT